jgi:hypothetical protein
MEAAAEKDLGVRSQGLRCPASGARYELLCLKRMR